MQRVGIRDQNWWSQDNEKDVSKQEIRSPQRHLDNLDDKLASGLGHGGIAKPTAIPFTCPPCTIGLIVFEFTSQKHSNENFLDGALDCDNGNDTQDSM